MYSGDVTISRMASATVFPVAHRVNTFSYAIRNIVVEAQRVEAAGMRVRYLNVGDPNVFGFKTPPHLIAAVERAMRDGHNGYGPSAGILKAREASLRAIGRRSRRRESRTPSVRSSTGGRPPASSPRPAHRPGARSGPPPSSRRASQGRGTPSTATKRR